MALLGIPVLVVDDGLTPCRTPALRAATCGAISELVVDKTTASEAPHPFARVAVLRLVDLKKVWEGFADGQGRWQADGLQPSLEYVALGIDQQRVYKATAAGPVKATVEGGDG